MATRAFVIALMFTPAFALGSVERDAATLAGDGDVPFFLQWLGIVAGVCGIGAVIATIAAVRSKRRDMSQTIELRQDAPSLSTATVLLIAVAIFLGALTLSALIADLLSSQLGLRATSSESGPLEVSQEILWIAAGVTALLSTIWLADRESRGALLLLGGGALIAAAREGDLHEKLNPKTLGDWGVRFRGDWWFSSTSPVLPRLLWAAIAIAIVIVGVYLVRRGGPALLVRGRRHGRLLPLLALVAFLMFLGFGFDDLLRYRPGINLRQSQVCEETIELAAPLVYFAALIWGIQLGRSADRPASA